MTFEEIINNLHDEVIEQTRDYSDESYIIILQGLVDKISQDLDCIKSELRWQTIRESKGGEE